MREFFIGVLEAIFGTWVLCTILNHLVIQPLRKWLGCVTLSREDALEVKRLLSKMQDEIENSGEHTKDYDAAERLVATIGERLGGAR